ncbi:Lar family restriction alleviation protein [Nitrobacter sp. TKz-YC01]|uniref:Lar family restriction alleviation protein n=1 Tax=Nitrobacter sp. TKz-YC01 TaxID=3398703 RepID=UPI003A1039F0
MTAPSIKEALELKPCPFCGGSDVVCCDQGDDDFAVTCKSCGVSSRFDDDKSKAVAAWNTRATLQPSGDRRGAIAQALAEKWPGDYMQGDDECEREPNALAYETADAAILASGLVQDEAAIRADERERCAKLVECDCCDVCGESPGFPKCANEIAAAIRSARNGGES